MDYVSELVAATKRALVNESGKPASLRLCRRVEVLSKLLQYHKNQGSYFFRFVDGPVLRRVTQGGVLMLEGIDKV